MKTAPGLLAAYGPLRKAPLVVVGDRVRFPFRGELHEGTIELVGPPFNGVQGIHAYASVRFLDSLATTAAKVDELEVLDGLVDALEPFAGSHKPGMLW